MPPEYWRNYRRQHPAYRAAELARNRHRKQQPAALARRRAYEAANRVSRAQPAYEPPDLSGEPLWRAARELVGPQRTALTSLYDPLWEDLISVTMVALLEGKAPEQALAAMKAYRTVEWVWGYQTTQLWE